MLTIGDARVTVLNGGNFRLDGGAMHGVVPKTLWSKLVSCDPLNRCEYATRCLLIEAAGKRVEDFRAVCVNRACERRAKR